MNQETITPITKTKPKFFKKKTKPKKENLDLQNLKPEEESKITSIEIPKSHKSKNKPKIFKKVTKIENETQVLKEEVKQVSKPVKKVEQKKKSSEEVSKKSKPLKKCTKCPKKDETVKDLEDFKELKRYFGCYHCERCHKHWKSGNSFKNLFQQCKRCKKKVVPHELQELEKSGLENTKDHEEDYCEACLNNLNLCNTRARLHSMGIDSEMN
jgi:hypothetical protein